LRDTAEWEAIVLARAGIDRLGLDLDGLHAVPLEMLPAIGQGAIGLEIRTGDAHAAAILAGVNHLPTFFCTRAERELLRLLDGDCRLPVGVQTSLQGERLRMKTIVFGPEDQPPLAGEAEGAADRPEELAGVLFSKIYGK
jgi:hydroxymethylbilane synthase